MALDTSSPAILGFGVFEVYLRPGELRKQGKRIKLQEQPFQVLTVLLRHPGEVVTREELRKQIWPQDTFVDFDNSLNTAINKLREALGDSADNPRFIETLPRRGYRFLAPVSGDLRESPPGVFRSEEVRVDATGGRVLNSAQGMIHNATLARPFGVASCPGCGDVLVAQLQTSKTNHVFSRPDVCSCAGRYCGPERTYHRSCRISGVCAEECDLDLRVGIVKCKKPRRYRRRGLPVLVP